MSVRGNLEFGLKARGLGAVERQVRVREMLALVRLEAHEKARPSQLSGGERQRVALALRGLSVDVPDQHLIAWVLASHGFSSG